MMSYKCTVIGRPRVSRVSQQSESGDECVQPGVDGSDFDVLLLGPVRAALRRLALGLEPKGAEGGGAGRESQSGGRG